MTVRTVILNSVLLLSVCVLSAGCGSADIRDDNKHNDNETEEAVSVYTWMTMPLPWDGLIDLPFIGNPHEKESEEKAIVLKRNTPYKVYLALGSAEYQVYNVVVVDSDGHGVAAYRDPVDWKYYQKKFTLTEKQIDSLTRVLRDNNAGELPASAISNGEESRVQGGLTLCAGGITRRSYFRDSWLKQFKNILTFVNDDILQYDPQKNNGFKNSAQNILRTDPEATKAVRGVVIDK